MLAANVDKTDHTPQLVARRRVLSGAITLVGFGLFLPGATGAMTAGVKTIAGGSRPTYVPEAGSTDPLAHSAAENLFWLEQLSEHAAFFIMLMPGDALAKARGEAEAFKKTFGDHLAKASTLDASSYKAFNGQSIEHTKRFVDYKHRMRDEQTAGRLKSLVWPTFFEHTALEGDHFIARLQRLSAGETRVDAEQAAKFWTLNMGEHAAFVSHLLDPAEKALIEKARTANQAFEKLHAQKEPRHAKAIKAVDDILDFKVAAEQGINAGTIKSIIDPALADHVRREAIKAADELRRAAA